MKKRFAVLALVFFLILSLASTAFAYTVPSDTVVYVTPTGECYHLRNCSYIQNSSTSLYISVAVEKGYRACSRCDPDVMVGTYGDSYAYKHPSIVIAENKPLYDSGSPSSNAQAVAESRERVEAKAKAETPKAEESKESGFFDSFCVVLGALIVFGPFAYAIAMMFWGLISETIKGFKKSSRPHDQNV